MSIDGLFGDSAAIARMVQTGWQPPAGLLAHSLGDTGRRRIVGGDERLDITTSGRIWLVLSGSVDLFLIDAHGRSAFHRVAGGGLIGDFEATSGSDVQLAGIPTAETEIFETTEQALGAVASDPECGRPFSSPGRAGTRRWLTSGAA